MSSIGFTQSIAFDMYYKIITAEPQETQTLKGKEKQFELVGVQVIGVN